MTNSPCARVFVQQPPFTRLPVAGESGFNCRWLAQQFRSPCAADAGCSAWQQHFPTDADEQQEPPPPQQQPVREEEMLRQNGLRLPFGQTQSKCGTLAIRVVTAANHTKPTCIALWINLIVSILAGTACSVKATLTPKQGKEARREPVMQKPRSRREHFTLYFWAAFILVAAISGCALSSVRARAGLFAGALA